jgi:pimeloyl-ACP methyl ester carboxylesterase
MSGRARPTLILLSGLLCDEQVWEEVRQRLTVIADIEVISFPCFSSIESMAERVLALAPGRFALAGHSMGGRVALEVYNRAPNRVSALALLNTGVHAPAPYEPTSRGRLVELARTEGMRALAAQWLPPMLAREYPPDHPLIVRLTRMIERGTPDSFAAQVTALLTRPDARTILPTVSVPVLLLSARDDTWSPPQQHAAMHELCTRSELVILEGAGHMAPAEQPEATALALIKWLNRVIDAEDFQSANDMERLLIADACKLQIYRYARLIDVGAWDAVSLLFSPDGALFRPSEPDIPVQGRSAILASLKSRPYRLSRHLVTNIEVAVESRTHAHAVSSIVLYLAESINEAPTIESTSVGRFHDHLVKSEHQWLFSARRGTMCMRGPRAV